MTTPLPVRLDRDSRTPLSVQLADGVRRLALDGTLTVGDRLPSTRALATDLGVSRATVDTAWDQLRAEGWVEGRTGSGTWVAAGPEVALRQVAPRPRATPARPLVPMDAGTPWRPSPVPRTTTAAWRRAWRSVTDATPPRGYDDPRGLPELRTALAERIARTRGLDVDPDDVLVTSGTTQGLRHALTGLPQRPVGVEDPGYRAAVAVVLASGRQVVDLPASGPVGDLAGLAAAYVTPAHQHPLGHVMGADERVRLLAEAERAGVLVIEDDYDSEFRYDVAPVPALAAMARGQVALLGTASKSVMPSLRLGWAVLPDHLRPTVDAFRALTHDTPPWAVQSAFAVMLRDGHVDAVVRAARRAYAERAPRVVAALSPYAELAGPVAGMYSTWLLEEERAARAQRAAEEAGFRVNLLSTYCRSAGLSGLVVGFGGPDDDELDRALEVLVAALG
ncbi:PLP-dependent aminotransferase family protein [Nocardioides daphniae]|uniref:GntR family transcriptional regulator n=1 Tax=Nocardioides daphniae TaxID=402297 RepID=A0A4P7UA67_9ACTN|nr:PLP-dependent aminotransferase family protein [Nocardioides daphniae]QCC76806.1 PLP-dependent aminotransferase family protein [Nocardioides daphniae]GGD16704.1 GntR family transcriptional regulator [Nocardioides daphniae]